MKLRLPDQSLSRNFIGMNLLVCAAALVLACTAFVGYDQLNFREDMTRKLSTQAQIIGLNSVTALLFNDPHSAENTLSALKAAPHVILAGIYTNNGEPFATYSREGAHRDSIIPKIPNGELEAHRFYKNSVVLVRSIVFQQQVEGKVYIEEDLVEVNGRLKQYAGIALIVLLVSLLAALPVSALFLGTVTRPIAHLAEIESLVSRDKDYSVRAAPTGRHDEVAVLIDSFNEMLGQIQKRDGELKQARDELELRVQERTEELSAANKELEAFCYSVSHDLRAPLRGIDGFSQALLEDYASKLDSQGQDCLQRVRAATQRMGALIDDLLALSRLTRTEMRREPVDLTRLAHTVADELCRNQSERPVELIIAPGLRANGDPQLLRVVLENLFGNAWKFSSKRGHARIEFGRAADNGTSAFFVRDNGAGFDPAYADRLFGAFQRLHAATEFPGTGVGLASVQRIIHRHGGKVWAESALDRGATFYFTL